MKELTLVMTYCNRQEHLQFFFRKQYLHLKDFCKIILVEEDEKPSFDKKKYNIESDEDVQYFFVKKEKDIFHKSRLINIGIQHVTTKWFCVYDVDLVPYNNSLHAHFALTQKIYPNVVAGYRLDIEFEDLLNENYSNLEVCSENSMSAIKKQLTTNERFGVILIYDTLIAKQLNGINEDFIGWGCEDQDFLERYLHHMNSCFLLSPDFLYLHIKHEHPIHWKNEDIVKNNRRTYYNIKSNA